MTEELTNIRPRPCPHPVANIAAQRDVMIGAVVFFADGGVIF